MNDIKRQEIAWSAPEFVFYEKDEVWFWGSMVIAAALAGIALWQGNFLFAIFIGIAEMMIVFWGRRRPRTFTFSLSERGLDIKGLHFYSYGQLEGFAFVDHPHDDAFKELVLRTKKISQPFIKIMVDARRMEDAKGVLLRFLPEITYRESLADYLARVLRF